MPYEYSHTHLKLMISTAVVHVEGLLMILPVSVWQGRGQKGPTDPAHSVTNNNKCKWQHSLKNAVNYYLGQLTHGISRHLWF